MYLCDADFSERKHNTQNTFESQHCKSGYAVTDSASCIITTGDVDG